MSVGSDENRKGEEARLCEAAATKILVFFLVLVSCERQTGRRRRELREVAPTIALEPCRSAAAIVTQWTPCEVEVGGGVMPLVAGCGAMTQNDDGVVIGVAKMSSTFRGGRCMWHNDVVIGTMRVSSTM